MLGARSPDVAARTDAIGSNTDTPVSKPCWPLMRKCGIMGKNRVSENDHTPFRHRSRVRDRAAFAAARRRRARGSVPLGQPASRGAQALAAIPAALPRPGGPRAQLVRL